MEQKVKLKLRAEKLTEDKLPLTKLRQEILTCPLNCLKPLGEVHRI